MNVDDIVAERIAAARARIEANKRRRAAFAAARQRGLAQRHAAKLRNLSVRTTDAAMGQPPTTEGQRPTVQSNRGDIATVAELRSPDGNAAVTETVTTVRDSLSPTNDTEENQ